MDVDSLAGGTGNNGVSTTNLESLEELLAAAPPVGERSGEQKQRIRECRERFALKYIPSLQFWKEWIADETEVQESHFVDELYNKSFILCPHGDLVLDYVNHFLSRHENDDLSSSQVRECFEKALSICGGDITHGCEIFNQYRSFEVEDYEDLLDIGASAIEIQEAKTRIVDLIHRQLSLPLIGNEMSLRDIENLMSEIFVASDVALIKPDKMQSKFTKALEFRSSRIIYEDNILSKEGDSSSGGIDALLTAWKTYIAFEVTDKDIFRAQRLYERAVLSLPDSTELWLAFTEFAAYSVKNWALVEAVTARSTRVLASDVSVWKLCFMSLEVAEVTSRSGPRRDDSQERPISDLDAVEAAISTAIQSGALRSADDYWDVYMSRIDYRRRQLKVALTSTDISGPVDAAAMLAAAEASSSTLNVIDQAVVSFRQACDEAELLLQGYYPDWVVGFVALCKYRGDVEDATISQVHSDGTIDEERSAMGKYSGSSTIVGGKLSLSLISESWERSIAAFGKQLYVWIEYITWLKGSRTMFAPELRRKLFKRAQYVVSDYPAEICRQWLVFERQEGSVSDLLAAIIKTKPVLQADAATAAAAAAAAAVVQDETAPATTKEVKSRKQENTKEKSTSESREETVKKAAKRKVGSAVNDTAVEAASNTDHTVESPLKKVRMAADSATAMSVEDSTSNGATQLFARVDTAADGSAAASVAGDEVDDNSPCPYTIIVKSLPFSMIEDDVKTIFADCGTVQSLNVILSKAGKSRGIAVVAFGGAAEASEALKLSATLVNGRAITVELGTSEAIQKLMTPAGSVGEATRATLEEGAQQASASGAHPTTIYVTKFSKEVSSSELRQMFEQFGEVLEAKLILDKKTAESKCCGLVQFATEAAKKAAFKLNKTVFHGHTISVLPSKFPAIVEGKAVETVTVAASARAYQAPHSYARRGLGFKPRANELSGNSQTGGTVRKEKLSLGTNSSTLLFKPRGL